MKIRDILQRTRPTVSFEFFPPKDEAALTHLLETLSRLRDLRPSFTSCTYGAGGSTRARTLEVTLRIKKQFALEAMAHFTCVGQALDDSNEVLQRFAENGIENVLALRGDRPVGLPEPAAGWFPNFKNAVDLIRHIRARYGSEFSIGCAGYPEKHPEAPDFETDLQRLKEKVAAGADFIITQLFFDNQDFFRFVDRARSAGIAVPVIAGIMPVTNVMQIKKFTSMCGAQLPKPMLKELEAASGAPAQVVECGIRWATRQCRELLQAGVQGLHFYTLNKSIATRRVVEELRREGTLR